MHKYGLVLILQYVVSCLPLPNAVELENSGVQATIDEISRYHVTSTEDFDDYQKIEITFPGGLPLDARDAPKLLPSNFRTRGIIGAKTLSSNIVVWSPSRKRRGGYWKDVKNPIPATPKLDFSHPPVHGLIYISSENGQENISSLTLYVAKENKTQNSDYYPIYQELSVRERSVDELKIPLKNNPISNIVIKWNGFHQLQHPTKLNGEGLPWDLDGVNAYVELVTDRGRVVKNWEKFVDKSEVDNLYHIDKKGKFLRIRPYIADRDRCERSWAPFYKRQRSGCQFYENKKIDVRHIRVNYVSRSPDVTWGVGQWVGGKQKYAGKWYGPGSYFIKNFDSSHVGKTLGRIEILWDDSVRGDPRPRGAEGEIYLDRDFLVSRSIQRGPETETISYVEKTIDHGDTFSIKIKGDGARIHAVNLYFE